MLNNEIKTIWKAVDKLVLENKTILPKTPDYEKYILAKKELIKEMYVIRRLLGESKESLMEGAVNASVNDYLKQSKNILVALSRKNRALAESVVYADKKTKKLLQLESMLFGDCMFNILTEDAKPKYSVGLTLAEAVIDAAARKMIEIAENTN